MRILTLVVAMALASCSSGGRQAPVDNIAAPVDPMTFQQVEIGSAGYRIGPTDKLRIRVFQVADLSFDEIEVDAGGSIQMPLIGSISASGRTPAELSDEIERLLSAQYLRDPQVGVTVIEAASQKVTVDGAVTKPGVYIMRGRTTLLQAIAMAEGPSKVAALDSVAVFRTVDGHRMVALFDLGAIRGGQATDPQILGDDIIVVDTSRLSVTMREVLSALPAFAVFGYY